MYIQSVCTNVYTIIITLVGTNVNTVFTNVHTKSVFTNVYTNQKRYDAGIYSSMAEDFARTLQM